MRQLFRLIAKILISESVDLKRKFGGNDDSVGKEQGSHDDRAIGDNDGSGDDDDDDEDDDDDDDENDDDDDDDDKSAHAPQENDILRRK